jgi:hypothetical protein
MSSFFRPCKDVKEACRISTSCLIQYLLMVTFYAQAACDFSRPTLGNLHTCKSSFLSKVYHLSLTFQQYERTIHVHFHTRQPTECHHWTKQCWTMILYWVLPRRMTTRNKTMIIIFCECVETIWNERQLLLHIRNTWGDFSHQHATEFRLMKRVI